MCDKCDNKGLCYTIIMDDEPYRLCPECWGNLVAIIKSVLSNEITFKNMPEADKDTTS